MSAGSGIKPDSTFCQTVNCENRGLRPQINFLIFALFFPFFPIIPYVSLPLSLSLYNPFPALRLLVTPWRMRCAPYYTLHATPLFIVERLKKLKQNVFFGRFFVSLL
jgi:hypothetical protein